MADTLYDTDALAWGEREADLLERLRRGERLNAEIDWANVIGEVRDVGLSELHACESLITQALLHLLKLACSPDGPDARHWRGEIAAFLVGAQRRFTPSMRQRIDMAELHADARRILFRGGTETPPAGFPADCPFALSDLLAEDFDIDALLARLPAASEHAP